MAHSLRRWTKLYIQSSCLGRHFSSSTHITHEKQHRKHQNITTSPALVFLEILRFDGSNIPLQVDCGR
jgi:hypothetical protein